MTSAIETALTELSANLRRMEQRHQATGSKFDRLYGLIDAAREELAVVSRDAARYQWLRLSPNPACDIALAKHFSCGRCEDFEALIDSERGGA